MSNLSELLPSGSGGKQFDFVASGTLPNGKPVVLNSNGTVTAVGATIISENIPASSEVVFSTANPEETSTSFDPNTPNKFVVGYINAGKGTVSIGTVSGTSISFGSGIIFNNGTTSGLQVEFDPTTAGKFVVVYQDGANSNYGTAIVGTISGASISFGSGVVYNSGNTMYNKLAFDPNTSGKFVAVYRDAANASHGTAIVGTVSGTSISFGTEVVFNAAEVNYLGVCFDQKTANKCVITFTPSSGTNYGTAIVGTVSGTSISFGTAVVFNAATTYYIAPAFDPNTANKLVVAYRDAGNSNYGTCVLGTVSGTSITFGSEYVFYSSAASYESIAFDPNTANKFVVPYSIGGTAYGHVSVGTISGSSISFGSSIQFNAGDTNFTSISFDSSTEDPGKFVVAYQDASNSNYATAILSQIGTSVTNLTATNFVGITDAAISSAATGKVTIKGGIKSGLSSLTTNSIYYVQADGTVTTASASPAVRIGRALSSTSINLEFNT